MGDMIGIFYGFIGEDLYTASGSVKKPHNNVSKHNASTTFGWCGWPVYIGSGWSFIHFQGNPNCAVYIGSLLRALGKVIPKIFQKDKGAKQETWQGLAGFLDDMRHDGEENFVRQTVNVGGEYQGTMWTDVRTGKVWEFDIQDSKAADEEVKTGRYKEETYEQSRDRVSSAEYYEDLDRDEAYKATDEQERKLEELDRQDKEDRDAARREEKRRFKDMSGDDQYQEALEHWRRTGDAASLYAIGHEPPSGFVHAVVPEPSGASWADVPVGDDESSKYLCVCGSQKRNHKCKTPCNVIGKTPEEILRLAKAAAAAPAPKRQDYDDESGIDGIESAK